MINNPASLPASDTYRHTYSPPEKIFKKDIARTGSNYEQLITTASWNSCPEAMILIPIFTSPSLWSLRGHGVEWITYLFGFSNYPMLAQL